VAEFITGASIVPTYSCFFFNYRYIRGADKIQETLRKILNQKEARSKEKLKYKESFKNIWDNSYNFRQNLQQESGLTNLIGRDRLYLT
jgi:hypothetical protein